MRSLVAVLFVSILILVGFLLQLRALAVEDDVILLAPGASRTIPRHFAEARVEHGRVAEIRKDLLSGRLRIYGIGPGETTLVLKYLNFPKEERVRVTVRRRVRDSARVIAGWSR